MRGSGGPAMNAVRIHRKLESETLYLPELKPLLGKNVEIIVQEESIGGTATAGFTPEASLPATESFVARANRLDRHGHRNAAMDLLYDHIDELMHTGHFEALDTILQRVSVRELSVDVLLGVLTATLPAKSRLSSRVELFRQTEAMLKEHGEWEEGLL